MKKGEHKAHDAYVHLEDIIISSFLKKDEGFNWSSSGRVLLHIMPSRSQSSRTYLWCRSCVEKGSEGGRPTLRGYNNQLKTSNLPTISTNVHFKEICNNHIEFRILKHKYSKDVNDIQRLVFLTQQEICWEWVHYDFPLVVVLTKSIISIHLCCVLGGSI